MEQLNFPNYSFTFKSRENKVYIFDLISKKNVLLSPEEWVRQHCVHFLINELGYPKSIINLEKQLFINGRAKRYDLVVYSNDGNVEILVECKAPSIKISKNTFDQIARYNLTLNSRFLMLTNGKEHYFCEIDFKNKAYQFIRKLPKYQI